MKYLWEKYAIQYDKQIRRIIMQSKTENFSHAYFTGQNQHGQLTEFWKIDNLPSPKCQNNENNDHLLISHQTRSLSVWFIYFRQFRRNWSGPERTHRRRQRWFFWIRGGHRRRGSSTGMSVGSEQFNTVLGENRPRQRITTIRTE